MILDERKRKILQAIIDNYIDTAEPVGSRTIARKHEIGLSSATIRNEMADLEEMGYLEQPHTSAGRIPSDKGYRLYVDHLMKLRELTDEEIDYIQNSMSLHISELGQIIRQASIAISKITKYTAVSMTPQTSRIRLKAIQVVPIEAGKALVIVVTNSGVIRNSPIKISEKMSPDILIHISNIFNERLSGLTLDEINIPVIRSIENKIGTSNEILMPVLRGVEECITKIDTPEIFLDGASNIFEYPEFRDTVKAREFLSKLDEKDVLRTLFWSFDDENDVSIQIGLGNNNEGIKDCSIIKTTYSLGDVVIGSIGVIGPTRMEYGKVISSMNYLRERVKEEIENVIGENFSKGGR
ncbi:MAG: heat-inducible transcriptional repressor HrcA [Clostridia bacterium]